MRGHDLLETCTKTAAPDLCDELGARTKSQPASCPGAWRGDPSLFKRFTAARGQELPQGCACVGSSSKMKGSW